MQPRDGVRPRIDLALDSDFDDGQDAMLLSPKQGRMARAERAASTAADHNGAAPAAPFPGSTERCVPSRPWEPSQCQQEALESAGAVSAQRCNRLAVCAVQQDVPEDSTCDSTRGCRGMLCPWDKPSIASPSSRFHVGVALLGVVVAIKGGLVATFRPAWFVIAIAVLYMLLLLLLGPRTAARSCVILLSVVPLARVGLDLMSSPAELMEHIEAIGQNGFGMAIGSACAGVWLGALREGHATPRFKCAIALLRTLLATWADLINLARTGEPRMLSTLLLCTTIPFLGAFFVALFAVVAHSHRTYVHIGTRRSVPLPRRHPFPRSVFRAPPASEHQSPATYRPPPCRPPPCPPSRSAAALPIDAGSSPSAHELLASEHRRPHTSPPPFNRPPPALRTAIPAACDERDRDHVIPRASRATMPSRTTSTPSR